MIHKEVKPALGCTEPIAVSLAVARASEELKESGLITERVEVEVSANKLKNGMGVGVLGTGMVGLQTAAASDARMAGCILPAIAAAETFNSNLEELTRAQPGKNWFCWHEKD